MRCPRCHREAGQGTVFCAGCGAPLALVAEPPPRALDASLSIDRRGDARPPGTPPPLRGMPPPASAADTFVFGVPPAPPRPGRAREVDRSGWDLGPPLGVRQPDAPRPQAAAPLAPAADAPEDDFEFGPLPDLRPEPARAAPRPPAVFAAAPDAGPEPLGAPALPADAPGRGLDAAPIDPIDVDVDAVEVHLRRPATWRRAASWAIDVLPFAALAIWALQAIAGAVPLAPGEPSGPAHALDLALRDGGALALPLAAGAVILGLVYQTLGHALAGATLGKLALGLRVVGPDGRRPTLARSAARAALSAASALLLGLGLLAALFTRSGRSLHDLAAGTWVVEAP
ncbi:RDD family protein [Anaeromyxobacter dehalogenans]|uniref:RDD n=1 Tax=Anaeromyxobacter dehalogenans (strain 2CP-C) TaxID=290397 RepID=Q2IMJ0_ANADE|nr:RDD family protein [Anaeromyxobacter dehalogenans]ABC80024.1 RDD [Anaeromyxobacter dehalogenans 2CP-C]